MFWFKKTTQVALGCPNTLNVLNYRPNFSIFFPGTVFTVWKSICHIPSYFMSLYIRYLLFSIFSTFISSLMAAVHGYWLSRPPLAYQSFCLELCVCDWVPYVLNHTHNSRQNDWFSPTCAINRNTKSRLTCGQGPLVYWSYIFKAFLNPSTLFACTPTWYPFLLRVSISQILLSFFTKFQIVSFNSWEQKFSNSRQCETE